MKRNRKSFRTPIQIVVFENSKVIFSRVFDHYPVVIGRSPSCDIPFSQFDYISKQHATIVEEDNQPVILDLESSNGIYFEGKRVKRAPITEDAVVSVSNLVIKFRFQTSEMTLAPQVSATPTRTLEQDKGKPFASLPKVSPEVAKGLPSFPGVSASSIKREPKIARHEVKHKVTRASLATGGLHLVEPHPMAANLKPNQRVLESYITWKDVIYDVQQFHAGEKITAGRGHEARFNIPTLQKRTDLAFFDGTKTQCFIPQGTEVVVRSQKRELSFDDLMKAQALTKHSGGYLLKLGDEDLASYDLGSDIKIHFRYAPLPKELRFSKVVEPDEEIRKSTFVSGIIHFIIMILAVINEPVSHAPKIKDVPDRFARLLVEPPRKLIDLPPPPKPTPPPPKPEKLVKQKQVPPKKIVQKVIQQKPKKVVLTKSPVLKQVNKARPVPTKVTSTKPSGNPVNVNNVGPLAALTALSSNASKSNTPVAININKNAGGPSSFTTSGVIGTLKTTGGKLQAGGIASVQTKGLGVGSGQGYGIQGLKGTAGSRGIAGSVVGNPQLMSIGSSEGLTRAQVMSVVNKHMAKIQQCFERSLFNNPGLAGSVEYEWEILPSGGVKWAKVKSSQMSGADAMNSCVVGIFRQMKFPIAKNGMGTTPNIPLSFGKL